MATNHLSIADNVFENGNVKDAKTIFEKCVRNAFPGLSFRNLELVAVRTHKKEVEGKSNNHIFVVKESENDGKKVFVVTCHRASHGESPDKCTYLDYNTLAYLKTKE